MRGWAGITAGSGMAAPLEVTVLPSRRGLGDASGTKAEVGRLQGKWVVCRAAQLGHGV